MKTISLLGSGLILMLFSARPSLALTEPHGTTTTDSATVTSLNVDLPALVLAGVDFEMEVTALNEAGVAIKTLADTLLLEGVKLYDAGEPGPALVFREGTVTVKNVHIDQTGSREITLTAGGTTITRQVRVIPGLLSLLPPIFTIVLAFVARQVLISLFSGIWLGALFIYDYNPITGFMKTIDTYLIQSLADPDHAAILIFSLTLGGMVGVMSKAGGTQGIVQMLSKYTNSRRGGMLATWAMGILIFFDDYANTLIVGNTLRPFTDRLRISREKLSYIVDSTAAPVASIAFISTWIGFQIGLIDQAFEGVGITVNAYKTFLEAIPYSTYSILALIFVFLLGVTLRDFGPMLKAEKRALETGQVLSESAQPIADSSTLDMIADEHTPLRWYNALVPIACVIIVTVAGLYVSGKSSLGAAAADVPIGTIFGAANSFHVLMWASFTGLFVAAFLALGQKILTLQQTIDSAINGYKSMILAAMILILAWAIGDICKDLHTADYVIDLSKGILSPHVVPLITFLIAAFISFSTGASWATMAILTPIVIPIAYKFPMVAGLSPELSHQILLGTIGAVLSGSVLGDHCSPISDTTILSSMASAADHIDHVRTQLPYAMAVGVVAIFCGYLPVGWGLNGYWSLIAGTAILAGVVRFLGKRVDA